MTDPRVDTFALQVAQLRAVLADIQRLAADGLDHPNPEVVRAVLARITDLLTVTVENVVLGAAESIAQLEQHDREPSL